MKKLLVLFLVLFGVSVAFANKNKEEIFTINKKDLESKISDAYMLGSFHLSQQLKTNYRVQGHESKNLNFGRYLVAIKLDKLATNEILIYQGWGYQESLRPVIVTNDNLMIYSSHHLEPDAKYTVDILNKNYFKGNKKNVKAYIIDNRANKTYTKAPYILKDFIDVVLADLKEKVKGKVYIIDRSKEKVKQAVPKNTTPVKKTEIKQKKKEIKKPVKKPVKKVKQKIKKKPTAITKYATLKGSKVETFDYTGGLPSYKSKWNDYKFYPKDYLLNRKQKIPYQNIIVTKDGTKYLKVLNLRMFIDIEDLNI